jgi:hypothetical protein
MDWDRAVERQTGDLLAQVGLMLAMLPGFPVPVLARSVHLAVLAVLRPAESAARRLIQILAQRIVVTPRARRAPPEGGIPRGKGSGTREPVFPLFDPRTHPGPPAARKGAPGAGPRITEIGRDSHVSGPAAMPVLPDDPVGAERLCRRLDALRRALGDLPKSARRLARMLASGRAKWRRVMRPGRPPGYRARGRRDVDEVLADCQTLALWAMREVKPP